MSKKLIRQLKTLGHAEVKPNEAWLQKNRELLLSQIKNTVSTETKTKFNFDTIFEFFSIFLPQSFVRNIIKPAVALVLIMAMGVGSWVATVSASYQALPGEFLYSAKRAAEAIQVKGAEVVGDKNNAAKLHLEFAKRRAVETKSIISQNDPEKIKIAAQTVDDLKTEIKNVNDKLDELKSSNGSAGELMKDVNKNSQEISGVLKEVKVNLLVNSDKERSADLSTQVSEVKNIVKDTAVKAVEIMVEKHLQGDESVSKDDVKQAISNQLQIAAKDVVESKESIAEVNKAINVVKTEVNAIVKETKESTGVNTSQIITDKIEATSKQAREAVSSSQKFSSETDKTVTEGQVLLSQDNLSLAMNKVKEVNAAIAEVEKITDATLKAVQEILPVVTVVAEANTSPTTTASPTSTPTSSTLNIILNVSGSSTIKFVTTTTSTMPVKTVSTTLKL